MKGIKSRIAGLRTFLFAVALVVGLTVVAADEMPDAAMLVSLNGGLSIRVAANDFTRDTAGISGASASDYSRMTFEIQIKPVGADDASYVTLPGALPAVGSFNEQKATGEYFLWDASETVDPGTYTVRARATAVVAGVTTGWKVLGDVTSVFHFEGTALVAAESQASRDSAFDGKVSTFFEYYRSDASIESWCGLDFGRTRPVARIRLIRRSGYASRATGALFQVADDPDFKVNLRTIYTCPAETEDFAVLETTLSEPVNARYVRVCTAGTLCCNFDEVEWSGENLPTVEPASLEDQTPVVGWTVFASEGVTSSQAEWAYRPDGDYTALGEAKSGAGSFSARNESALVGLPIYYRVRCQLSGGGESVSPSVKLVRSRQLERESIDQSKLATGVTQVPCSQYSTTVAESIVDYSASRVFDGDAATYAEIYYKVDTVWNSPELLLGVRLPEAAHITSAYALTRDSTAESVYGRLKYMSVLAAATDEDYAATNTVLLSAPVKVPSVGWYRYDSLDADGTYQYVFGYDGPLVDGPHGGFYGNLAEIRFYGWTASDERAAGFIVDAPTVGAASPADPAPVVKWTAPDLILSSCVECAYQEEGPYWSPEAEHEGAGSFVFTNTSASVGLALYYRIRYTSVAGETATASVAYTKLRNLNTTTRLFAAQYDPDLGANWTNPSSSYAFDGNEATWPDNMMKSTYAAVNVVVGVKFQAASHLVECWALPRTGTLWTRLKGVDLFAATTQEDFETGNKVLLAPALGDALVESEWNRYVSTDASSQYLCAFLYSANGSLWCGNVAEVKFMGWTEADRKAAGAVGAPEAVSAEPDLRKMTVRWGTSENAEKIRIERRLAGTDEWTIVADDLDPSLGFYVDTGLANRKTYEYRVSGIGLQGRMIVSAAAVSATTLAPGVMLIIR